MQGQGSLRNVPRKYFAVLLAGLLTQMLFWAHSHTPRNEWRAVRLAAPSAALADALRVADDQFTYRALALGLQNAGDFAGEMTPLKDFDYGRLAGWFSLLSEIDPDSQYIPALAGYYYGQSRNPDQLRHIVTYLQQLAVKYPQKHWRWLAYSVYLARHRIKDQSLALELAYQLAALQVADLPIWTRQMPAFVLADIGEKEAARDILEAILATSPDLQQAEQNFIRNYIDTRLGKIPEIQ